VEGLEVTLAEKREVAEDTALLRFKLPDENAAILVPKFGHVNLQISGARCFRSYTPIYSMEVGSISFIVRRVPGGAYSTHLVRDIGVGDAIRINGPFAPAPTAAVAATRVAGKRVLMVAAGTGIVPFLPVLETAAATCDVLVLDKSESRSVGLNHTESPTKRDRRYMPIYDRGEFTNRLDALLQTDTVDGGSVDPESNCTSGSGESKESPDDHSRYDAVLICGPNAFNVSMKNRVRGFGYTSFAVGTDDH